MVPISWLYDSLPFLFSGCLDGCRGFGCSCHLFNSTNTECQLCTLGLTQGWQFSGEQNAHSLCSAGKMLHNIFTTITHTVRNCSNSNKGDIWEIIKAYAGGLV